MCGIYASIRGTSCATDSCENCSTNIVFKGVKNVEYRGYDSWGVAVVDKLGQIVVQKQAGKTPEKHNLPCSAIGLGHTRWATHGGATDENAHPHLDCSGKIAIVHNGQIENYRELLEEITDHLRRSETDTEVIAHLLEDEVKNNPDQPFDLAVRKVHARLTGNNAVIATNGDIIVGIASGSPLVYGITKDKGYVVSSDELALTPDTRMTYTAKDNELVVLNSHALLYKTADSEVEPVPFKMNEQDVFEAADMAEFPHFMLKEIFEQPNTLLRLLEDKQQIKDVAKILNNSEIITMLGCGSAHYATLAAKYLFAIYANKRVMCDPASEFAQFSHLLSPKDTILAFSQSGTTIDLLDETRKANHLGAKIVAFVNVKGSALDQESNAHVHLKSGLEKAVLATKSFSHMVAAAALVATEMGGTPELGEQIVRENIESAKEVIRRKDEINAVVNAIDLTKEIFVFGRGISYPISLEAALKAKEGSYTTTEGFAGGEFKHGVMALIEENTPMIAITPDDSTLEEMLNNIEQVKARGAKIIGIGPKKLDIFDYHIFVPKAAASSVIANAVAVQLFGYYLALAQGTNPDMPRNLAKSVTVK